MVGKDTAVIVYLDLIFLVNFVIDGALMLTTAWTAKTRVPIWRIGASAFIGATYVIFMLFPALSFLFTMGIKFLFSLLMIVTAFGFGSLQRFLRHLGIFYLINFAAAGAVFGFYYFLLSGSEVLNGILYSHTGGIPFGLNAGMLIFVLPLGFWLFMRIFRTVKQKENLLQYMAEVQVKIGDFLYSCSGLVDTGNQLYDPLTKTPVMVIEALEWKEFIPEDWMKRIKEAETDRILSAMGENEFIWQDRLRLVPYRGVNRGTQFMLAIKPDQVTVSYNDKQVETQKVLIGLDGGTLSPDGSYHAIIHPMLLEA